MKAHVVIGSGYGDEGKGLFTDYLSSLYEGSTVVRFNGGAQAGHTVTTDKERHVFGHYCSNALLGKSHITFLSKYFVVNPMLFKKEKESLYNLGYQPSVIISPDSLITLPYDILINQLLEKKRGDLKHGSCGVGFGETIERSEKGFPLYIKDVLNNDNVINQIKNIRDKYFLKRVQDLGLINELNDYSFLLEDNFINILINQMRFDFQDVKLSNDLLLKNRHIIFEGAQGLLLDQDLGYFPHVTRSNTGLKNIINIIKDTEIKELDVVYATRCYTTRHGAGPLENELKIKPYENIVDKTNIHNEYQGTLRFSFLNIDLLKETIKKDIKKASIPNDIKINIRLGVSCLDQTENISFYYEGKIRRLSTNEFCKFIEGIFPNSLYSFGPSRKTIRNKAIVLEKKLLNEVLV